MTMATVHMMIGIPGSGKTTYAKALAKTKNYKIVSTDYVRMLHPNWNENLIWPEVYRLCASFLAEDNDIIFDATNITPKVRQRFKDEVLKHYQDFQMKAYFFTTNLQLCMERVEKRNKMDNELFLPIEVIASYSEKIIEPTLDEGFIDIIKIDNSLERRL